MCFIFLKSNELTSFQRFAPLVVNFCVVLSTSAGPGVSSSADRHQALGHRPAELPDHHDEKRRHQTFPVHGLPPQVEHVLAPDGGLWRVTRPAHSGLSPPSVPSFQSLPEDVLSKLADVLEEVTFLPTLLPWWALAVAPSLILPSVHPC